MEAKERAEEQYAKEKLAGKSTVKVVHLASLRIVTDSFRENKNNKPRTMSRSTQ